MRSLSFTPQLQMLQAATFSPMPAYNQSLRLENASSNSPPFPMHAETSPAIYMLALRRPAIDNMQTLFGKSTCAFLPWPSRKKCLCDRINLQSAHRSALIIFIISMIRPWNKFNKEMIIVVWERRQCAHNLPVRLNICGAAERR